LRGADRADAHVFRIDAGVRVGHQTAPVPSRLRHFHQHHGGGGGIVDTR
jgi:hypothetical protein